MRRLLRPVLRAVSVPVLVVPLLFTGSAAAHADTCQGVVGTWAVREGGVPVDIGYVSYHAVRCWDSGGYLTSHQSWTTTSRTIAGIAAGWRTGTEPAQLISSNRYGAEYNNDAYFQLCVPLSGYLLCGFREKFRSQVTFIAEKYTATVPGVMFSVYPYCISYGCGLSFRFLHW